MIGIQAAPFSKAIHAGVLTSDHKMFKSGPQDVTDMAFAAVVEFMVKHYDGHFELGEHHVEIKITPSEESSNV